MPSVRLVVAPGEARTLRAMLDERAQLLNMIQGAVQMICARHGIPAALFSGVDGEDGIVLDVSDDDAAKLGHAESPETGAGVAGAISAAPNDETPGNGQGAGKADGLKPVVDAPDAGIPAGEGVEASRGQFRHTEGG